MAEDIKNDFYSSEDVETDNNLPALKMAVISPQPTSPNGIGDYTARLIEEFRLLNPKCSIITPSKLIPGKKSERTRNWQGKELPSHWPDIFLGAIDAAQVSLVHIQHATYIGHGHDLTRFLVGLKTRGIPCVMTLHGVWSPTLTRRWPVSFYRLLAENAVQVIVHQKDGAVKFLVEQGIPPERISVIPLGTWSHEDTPKVNISNVGETPGRRIVLFAGLIFPRKGLHTVLRAFPEVVRHIPEACLLVVGKKRNDNIVDQLYYFWLRKKMRSGMKEGWLIQRPEYVPDQEFWARICSADVIVFPYSRLYGSSSAVFHRALAAGRPVICSHIPTFAEAVEAWGESLNDLILSPYDTAAWSRSLIRILSDEPFRKRAMEAAANLGRKTSGSLVAREHWRVYQKLLPQIPSKEKVK